MNQIVFKNITKKYSGQLIFRNVNFEIRENEIAALTGYNGSGKSTLLQIIAGYVTPDSGTAEYFFKKRKIIDDELYKYISFAAPYSDLIEDFTLKEMITFYLHFKKLSCLPSLPEIMDIMQISAQDKKIKFFSSGMKQRVKIALALLSNVSLTILDEPLSNLDQNGIKWYQKLLNQNKMNKIIFISSNRIKEEIEFYDLHINIEDYK